MNGRLLAITHSGLLISAALVSGCSKENFPVTPTPIATSAVVLQGTKYEGTIARVNGGSTSFNMTLIARGLTQAASAPSLTGNFVSGDGLTGTVQGTLTGTLDNGTFQGSLIATSTGHTDEQQYSGPVTTSSAALAPGNCVQGNCAGDGLTGAVQTAPVQTPTKNPLPPCSFSISSTSTAFPTSGGTGTATVTTVSGCAWSVITTQTWINIVSAASGVGPGTVTFTVQANTGAKRQGGLSLGTGQTFNITQATSCSYSLVPASASVPVGGGSFSTALTTSCSWTASSDVSWITGISPASGTTGATITYTVAPNTDTAARPGHITVTGPDGSAQLTVTQPGIICTYALNPAAQPVPSAGGSFSTALTTSCSWTASSDVTWITGISPASGTTGGTIAYTVAPNTDTAARSGHITVTGRGGSAPLTVTQLRVPHVTAPTPVSRNGTVTMDGTGFTPSNNIVLHFLTPGGTEIQTNWVSDSTGNFQYPGVPATDGGPGNWELWAVDRTTGQSSNHVMVTVQ